MGVMRKNKSRSLGEKATRSGRRPERLTLDDYRSLAEHSPDIIDRFDRDFRHLYINPAGARLNGVSAAQIIGKTIRETGVPEPYCSLWEDRIRKVFETARPCELRDTFQNARGVLTYYESRCVPEFAPDGTVRTVLVVSRDISSHARLEESMRESETLLRKIIELSPMAMAIVGMDGVIEYINRKAIETFGYSPEDIPTMEEWWRKAYPEKGYRKQSMAKWMGHVQKAMEEQTEIQGDDYRVTCKDGAVKTMFVFGVPVASKVFVMFNDVTAYKTLQGDLEAIRDGLEVTVKDRTTKLQALAEEVIRVEHRERRRIAYILHEDLQQWLVAAKFKVGELQGMISTPSAREAATRLQAVLDKAMEVTRSLTVDLRPPIIHERGLKMALRWLAADMKHKFTLSVQIKAGPVAERVSEEMGIFVFEAVRELLMNIVKHAGVRDATIQVNPEGRNQFRVEVSDKGRGFNPARTGKRKFGLFSIRERADILNGGMTIVSRRGRGTTIKLTLPVKSGKS
jgi:PAS domain S-box-containing protein